MTKTLGKTNYKNSKKKKKIALKKVAVKKQTVTKDRQIKVKIKHLEKELERITKAILAGKIDKKTSEEKVIIEKKISQLKILNDKFTKKEK